MSESSMSCGAGMYVVFRGGKECISRRPEIKAIYSKDFPRSSLAAMMMSGR